MLVWTVKILLLGTLVSCANLKRHESETPVEGENPVKVETRAQEDQIDEKKEKLGLVLGPGYLKSFAHIGVLKELELNNIQVDAIAGIGWGAIVAGGYSVHGRISEVEWQMFKLDESLLPKSTLFSKAIKAKSPQALDPFLEKVFKDNRVENAKIDFSCSTTNLRTFGSKLVHSGSYVGELKRCLGGNTFYSDYRSWVWDPYGIEAILKHFKEKGITKIMLVDVISPSDYSLESNAWESLMDYYTWGSSDRKFAMQSSKVDYYLQVNIKNEKWTSHSAIRAFSREGQRAAIPVVEKISREMMGR